jgi:hypothetical protein
MADTLHSQYVKGNLVFWQDHRKRWVDAIGTDVVKWIDDFVAGVGADAQFDNFWTVTRVETGLGGESTVARTDQSGGALLITTDNAENDGINMQLLGESFELSTDQVIYFGAFGVKMSDATQSDLFIGLAITDTDILGGVTDSIGFRKVDASAAVSFLVEKDSTETTATAYTAANDTAADMEFLYDGRSGTLEAFVNGASIGTVATTNLPNDELLRPSVHFLTGAAAAITCTIDKMVCIQIGR